jgi:hypothetical protein
MPARTVNSLFADKKRCEDLPAKAASMGETARRANRVLMVAMPLDLA